MRRLRDTMREDLRAAGDERQHDRRSTCAARGGSPSTSGGRRADGRGGDPRVLAAPRARARAAARRRSTCTPARLRFLYGVTLERPEEMARIPRMRVPMHVPVVLSGTEVERLLGAHHRCDRHRVVAMLAYGAGLRVSEVCRLRVDDVDPKRMVLRIRGSKRGRERYVMLSPRLLSALRAYWKVARPRRRTSFADAGRARS